MKLKTKQGLSLILAIGSVGGTVATVLMVRKAAIKESEISKRMSDNGNHVLSKRDIFEMKVKPYIPSMIVGMVTLGSIIGSNILNHKAQLSLISMATIADRGYRKYKHKVKDILGMDVHNEIVKSMSDDTFNDISESIKNMSVKDGEVLYYEERLGFFYANPEKLAYAYADINQRINVPDYGNSWYYALLYDFINLSGARFVNGEPSSEELNWGWSLEYLRNIYESQWIHMEINDVTNEVGVNYKFITWREEPVFDPGTGGSHVFEFDKPSCNIFNPVLGKKVIK